MEFKREAASWLFSQDFWLEMSPEQKESWLQHRETVTMEYEDVLFLRELEREHMEQEDVVEMSKLNFDCRCSEEVQSLNEYKYTWRVLGGGPNIAARLHVTWAPRTPLKKRRRLVQSNGSSDDPTISS